MSMAIREVISLRDCSDKLCSGKKDLGGIAPKVIFKPAGLYEILTKINKFLL